MRALGAVGLGLSLAGCLELNPDFGAEGGGGTGLAESTSGSASSSAGSSSGELVTSGVDGGSDTTGSQWSGADESEGADESTTGEPSSCFDVWHGEGWTMSPPMLVEGLNSETYEVDPFVTADGLTMYFGSQRNGAGFDIFKATRVDLDAPFEDVELEIGFGTDVNDTSFSPQADGLSAVFTSDRPLGAGGADLWIATRDSLDAAWDVAPLEELNTPEHEFDAAMSTDGLRIYWTVAGNAPDNLFVAERRDSNEPFSEPQVLEELESQLYDDSPRLAPDETIVLFSSLRAGGEGDHDVWYAVRSDRSVPFEEPRLVPTINSMHREGEARLFHDGCGLYFVSSDPDGVGGWDLYESRIVP